MSDPTKIVKVGKVESTMATCRKLVAAGELEAGQAVLASHQTHGRGRSDRSWQDLPNSSVLMTMYNEISLDPAQSGSLSILGGVVVAETLFDLGIDARIKWPNDILVHGRKCAGILITTTTLPGRIRVFAGVGVNVRAIPVSVADLATCVANETDRPVGVIELATEIYRRWNNELVSRDSSCLEKLIDRWTGMAAWLGETVSILTSSETSGRLVGIDHTGRLLLDVDGQVRACATGDVSRGPRLTR